MKTFHVLVRAAGVFLVSVTVTGIFGLWLRPDLFDNHVEPHTRLRVGIGVWTAGLFFALLDYLQRRNRG
jgi:hypothetical protein